jgi:lysozyme family protein
MKSNFRKSLDAVLKHEGGYSNHPRDPGGATMKGVTQRVYDAWRKNNGKPVQSVRGIAQEEIEAIYYQQYWLMVRGDQLPSGLDYAVFDFAVNSGPGKAIRELQRVLGIIQDGIPGNVTIQTAFSGDTRKIINDLCDRRMLFLQSLSTFDAFGKGWISRVSGVRSMALAMQTVSPEVVQPKQPTPPPVIPAPVSKGASIGQVMVWIVGALLAGLATYLGLK